MGLIAELRRRNVFRVGIAYAVVAWLLLQVADVLIDNIGAPDWVFPTLLMALGIGLPVALIFAWAFEMTPEGLKRESEVERSASITPHTGRKLDRVIIVVLALGLAYFAFDKFSAGPEAPVTTAADGDVAAPAAGPAVPPDDPSIAVLPFVNMSAEQDNEYFSDGLSEELLNLLARVEGLKVAARTSTFKFKGSDADIAEIGERLNVGMVLEGSVRRAGDQVRITAQLIKVDDGFHLWSQTYDRRLDNTFAVQDEIATAIVEALRLPLLGEAQAPVEAFQPASFEAFDLYLLGKHHARRTTGEGFEQAIDYFSRAVAIDPGYAPAWSELAIALGLSADFGDRDMLAVMAEAEAAADRALELAPRSADALLAMATVRFYQGRTVEGADYAERALEADPENAEALWQNARRLIATEPQRAVLLAEQAQALDPLSDLARAVLIEATTAARGYDAGRARFLALLERDPDNPMLHETWAGEEANAGNAARAIRLYEKVWQLRPGDTYPAFRIMRLYLDLDDREKAGEWLERAQLRGPDTRWARFSSDVLGFYDRAHESLLSEFLVRLETPEGEDPRFQELLGDVLAHLGRRDEAEAAYRRALELLNVDAEGPPTGSETSILISLVYLLPPGDERQQLLDRARERLAVLERSLPATSSPALLAAAIASLEGNREQMFAALDRAVDGGFRGAGWLEGALLYAQWRNDPRFREVVGRLDRIAAEQRARLEATEGDDALPGSAST